MSKQLSVLSRNPYVVMEGASYAIAACSQHPPRLFSPIARGCRTNCSIVCHNSKPFLHMILPKCSGCTRKQAAQQPINAAGVCTHQYQP
jgi:hypothetical protein